jgi:hypothetical protein
MSWVFERKVNRSGPGIVAHGSAPDESTAMPRLLAAAVLAIVPALPALATDYVPVSDRDAFVELVGGKDIHHGVFGINLNVLPDGTISGRAIRWDITGTWSWQEGFFCREMDWGGMVIDYNCQLVEVRGDDRIRFTVDRGAGEAAAFDLRPPQAD